MSKVVTIPKDRNPFVVIVNGVKHSYPAGVTTEVPDEVADVIEKYVGAKPKPNPNAGGGVSWNDLKDKPFGDSPTGGDTLYWDGNTEGLVNVEGILYKVSNAVPTKADFANGCIYQAKQIGGDDVNDFALTAEEAQAAFFDDGGAFFSGFGIIPFDNYEAEGLLFREAGVYITVDSMHVTFITIPGYTGFPVTKKMEEKYLPGAVVMYVDEENYLYTTSDTSDTSKRMTRAELMSVMQSGRVAYCTMTDETGTGYLPVQTYTFTEEYGQAMLVLLMGQSFLGYSVYTAEYTVVPV